MQPHPTLPPLCPAAPPLPLRRVGGTRTFLRSQRTRDGGDFGDAGGRPPRTQAIRRGTETRLPDMSPGGRADYRTFAGPQCRRKSNCVGVRTTPTVSSEPGIVTHTAEDRITVTVVSQSSTFHKRQVSDVPRCLGASQPPEYWTPGGRLPGRWHRQLLRRPRQQG